MSYYLHKKLKGIQFNEARSKVIEALKQEGFGVITQIDLQSTFKSKLDVQVRPYEILGACNPDYAYKALQSDSKLGVFLPCNVLLEENEQGEIEVSAIDPQAAMATAENPEIDIFAQEIRQKLQNVLNNL
jgi:uncharacterized protein (DUF302 family)